MMMTAIPYPDLLARLLVVAMGYLIPLVVFLWKACKDISPRADIRFQYWVSIGGIICICVLILICKTYPL